jgi:hypothetical protein
MPEKKHMRLDFTPADYEKLKRVAAHKRIGLRTYVRLVAIEAIRRDLPETKGKK